MLTMATVVATVVAIAATVELSTAISATEVLATAEPAIAIAVEVFAATEPVIGMEVFTTPESIPTTEGFAATEISVTTEAITVAEVTTEGFTATPVVTIVPAVVSPTLVEFRMHVVEAIPGAGADEYAVYEIARSPVAIGRASKGIVGIISELAHRRRIVIAVIGTNLDPNSD